MLYQMPYAHYFYPTPGCCVPHKNAFFENSDCSEEQRNLTVPADQLGPFRAASLTQCRRVTAQASYNRRSGGGAPLSREQMNAVACASAEPGNLACRQMGY